MEEMRQKVQGKQVVMFVDLDGVIVDFEGFARDVIGVTLNEADKKAKAQFWSAIHRHVRAGNEFFGAMKPMVDAFVLWDYIKHRNPSILSATGVVPDDAADQKRNWTRTYLGDDVADRARFVTKSKEKAIHVGSDENTVYLLIDDRSKSIEPWCEAGGIGILHTSAMDTINQLKDLGL